MSNYENANWLYNAFGNNLFCSWSWDDSADAWLIQWVELIHWWFILRMYFIIMNIGTHAKLHYKLQWQQWRQRKKNWIIYLITVTNQIKKQLRLIDALENPVRQKKSIYVQKIMHHLVMFSNPIENNKMTNSDEGNVLREI